MPIASKSNLGDLAPEASLGVGEVEVGAGDTVPFLPAKARLPVDLDLTGLCDGVEPPALLLRLECDRAGDEVTAASAALSLFNLSRLKWASSIARWLSGMAAR